jgi:hypothetical protein
MQMVRDVRTSRAWSRRPRTISVIRILLRTEPEAQSPHRANKPASTASGTNIRITLILAG